VPLCSDGLASTLTGRFLSENTVRLPPPLPFPVMDKFILTLENVAAKLDEVAQHPRMHISRKNTAGSREHAVFMRLMGMQMQELFGRWLDNEVADLTNILFPQRTTTRETVSATRRTTQKARARKH
jgi:hypothetical protein